MMWRGRGRVGCTEDDLQNSLFIAPGLQKCRDAGSYHGFG